MSFSPGHPQPHKLGLAYLWWETPEKCYTGGGVGVKQVSLLLILCVSFFYMHVFRKVEQDKY